MNTFETKGRIESLSKEVDKEEANGNFIFYLFIFFIMQHFIFFKNYLHGIHFHIRNSQWENNNLSLIILYLWTDYFRARKINTFED